MARFTIPRRLILRGVGGATLALPALEAMTGGPRRAAAAGRVTRFLASYVDTSIATAQRFQHRVGIKYDFVTPEKTGLNWEETPGTKSIFTNGVKDEMGLISGLALPIDTQTSPNRPNPGSGILKGSYHTRTRGPQFTGVGSSYHAEIEPAYAESCDQIMARVINGPDQYMATLPLSLSPGSQLPMAFKAPIPGQNLDPSGQARALPVATLCNPMDVYRKLFGQDAPTSGAANADGGWKNQKSVIDAVSLRLTALIKRCGEQDKRILTRHADGIRDLEKQIDQLRMQGSGGIPPAPQDIRTVAKPYLKDKPVGGKNIYDVDAGYADEKLRGPIQAALIHEAFKADRARVVTWGGILPSNQYPITGVKAEMHYLTHNSPTGSAMAPSSNWAIGNLAQLVKLMSETLDFDGSRMIDNSALCMLWEGGSGHATGYVPFDEEEAKFQEGFRDPHSVENMVVVVAGGRNLGLHPNQHIHYESGKPPYNNAKSPTQVILTMMRALGHTGLLGRVTETLPEMRVSPGA